MFESGIRRTIAGRLVELLLLVAFVTSGCRGNSTAPANVEARAPVARPATRDAVDRAQGCRAQADRIAQSSLRGDDRPLHWTPHYSPKYDQCYVQLERRIGGRDGSSLVISELWEPFEAVVLAVHTTDAHDRARRSYCQVALSDDPFTSCMVSKFFIDEHMQH
jgi:hypothetical protein